MGVGSFAFWLGYRTRKPKDVYHPDVSDILEKRRRFHARYGVEASRFFDEYPNVIRWGGDGLEKVTVTLKEKNGFRLVHGSFLKDEDGYLEKFISNDGTLTLKKVNKSLRSEMLISQIKGLLKDNEDVSRYCEQISATLIEDDSCIFNAPYGLHMKDTEFSERYGSLEWKNAWEMALKSELPVGKAEASENVGIGCFMLFAK